MTFDFRSVPRGDKLTVTFFPALLAHDLRHFLEEQGITDWSIVTKPEALKRFPDTKVPTDIRLTPTSPRVEKCVKCLISYYDPDAMYAEILKVTDSPEACEYTFARSKQFLEEYGDEIFGEAYDDPWAEEDELEPYDTPKAIYDYLDRLVWKQDAAKKAAAVIAYNTFKRGVKSNSLFIGPSGCGKTHIWRCLQKIFPGRIVIEDISNLTNDGWKGSKKWADLLLSPVLENGLHNILVLDEADKMLTPKFSNNENVSHSLQSESLTILEGIHVDIKVGSEIHSIDTSKISFVLCGAFSNKARDVAEKSAGSPIGFGAVPRTVQPYTRPLGETDLIEFGVMPEFMGRIQRVVNLEPMTEEDYYRMTDSSLDFLSHIGDEYKARIRLTPQKRRELAGLAARTGLGIRGMENQIRQLVDNAIFDDCEQRCFEF